MQSTYICIVVALVLASVAGATQEDVVVSFTRTHEPALRFSSDHLTLQDESSHIDFTTIHMTLGDRILDVHLWRNKRIHDSLPLLVYGADGQGKRHPEPLEHCFYQGHIDEDPLSQVAVHTCHGGVQGHVIFENISYYLEPQVLAHNNERNKANELHVLKRADRFDDSANHHSSMQAATDLMQNLSPDTAVVAPRLLALQSHQYTIELVVVGSTAFNALFINIGGESAARQNIIAIVNIVDALYQSLGLGIRVVPKDVVLFQSAQFTPGQQSIEAYLTSFTAWHESSSYTGQPADAFAFLNGNSYPGGAPGYGTVSSSSICNTPLTMNSVNQYLKNGQPTGSATATGTSATVIAHELGHNMGVNHVDNLSPPCIGSFIMNSNGVGKTVWSTCAKNIISGLLSSATCLTTFTNTVLQDCGYGYYAAGSTSTTTCKPCTTECSDCGNDLRCTRCPTDKVLINGACVSSCINGWFEETLAISAVLAPSGRYCSQCSQVGITCGSGQVVGCSGGATSNRACMAEQALPEPGQTQPPDDGNQTSGGGSNGGAIAGGVIAALVVLSVVAVFAYMKKNDMSCTEMIEHAKSSRTSAKKDLHSNRTSSYRDNPETTANPWQQRTAPVPPPRHAARIPPPVPQFRLPQSVSDPNYPKLQSAPRRPPPLPTAPMPTTLTSSERPLPPPPPPR